MKNAVSANAYSEVKAYKFFVDQLSNGYEAP